MKGLRTLWALLPLKAPHRSKTRLWPVLSVDECAGLVRAMAQDVLATLHGVDRLRGIALVGDDPWIRALGRTWGDPVIPEPAKAGLNASLDFAAAELAGYGADSVLILPGDLPTLSIADVEQLLRRPGRGLTICAATRDGGTNALVCELPLAFPFRFGTHSAHTHRAVAEERGIQVQQLSLPAFGRDIDTPADLAWLAQRPGRGETQAFLERSGLRHRLGLDSGRLSA